MPRFCVRCTRMIVNEKGEMVMDRFFCAKPCATEDQKEKMQRRRAKWAGRKCRHCGRLPRGKPEDFRFAAQAKKPTGCKALHPVENGPNGAGTRGPSLTESGAPTVPLGAKSHSGPDG